jgi:hypothetical protein
MAKGNLKFEDSIRQIALKDWWLKANRGVLAEVSRELSSHKPISRQFVGMVYRGKRRSKRVEVALTLMRAPGFAPKATKKTIGRVSKRQDVA